VPIGKDFNLAIPLLRNNELNGSIPMEFGALSNLEELEVGRNQLSNSIPPDLANCSRLSYLSPDRNNRTGEIPVEVSQGEQLDEFFLQQNAFQGTIPSSLGNLTPLQNSNLGNSKFNGSIPRTLGDLTNLQTLNVSENNLQGLIPTALSTRFNTFSFARNPLLRGTPLTGSQAIGHHHSSGSSTGAITGMDVRGAGLLALIILPSICGLCICVGWQGRGTIGAKAKAVAETLIVMFHEAITIAHIHDSTGHFAEDHAIVVQGLAFCSKQLFSVTNLHQRLSFRAFFFYNVVG